MHTILVMVGLFGLGVFVAVFALLCLEALWRRGVITRRGRYAEADPNDGGFGEAAYCHHRHHLDEHSSDYNTCPHYLCKGARKAAARMYTLIDEIITSTKDDLELVGIGIAVLFLIPFAIWDDFPWEIIAFSALFTASVYGLVRFLVWAWYVTR